MTLQRRIRRARALELAEFRLERLTLKLEQMTKGMRIASRAFERFGRVMRGLSEEQKMRRRGLPDCSGEGEEGSED